VYQKSCGFIGPVADDVFDMTDRFVINTWWILILTLVAATAIGSIMTGYFGLFALVAAHWTGGLSLTIASAILGGAAYLLCRYREDLVGD
jgi:hypothetical protein